MFKDFFTNAALLIASFSLMGQIFKNKPLNLKSPFSTKLNWGLSFGILGNILMLFGIQINTNIIADLRHIAIVIAAAFGGFIPALITSLLIAIGRIVFFGFNQASLLPSFGALLTGLLCGGISKLKYHPKTKAFVMNLIGLLIISIIFIIRIDDLNILKDVLLVHYTFSFIGGFIAYHFLEFVAKSNTVQRELQISVIKLKETEERFRLIAEYSSDMITMHNENGEFIYISPAVKEIIKFEYPELLGKNFDEFIHPDDLGQTHELFNKALNEGVAQATYRYRSKLGDYVWIESTLKSVHFQEDGSKQRVIIVSRNITDRKLTEQKLHEANELLNRLSFMDGLTGIANRRFFDQTLENEWSKSISMKSPITLLMFDIDYFKKYNDTYGHLSGDFCLQSIAQAIQQLFPSDSGYSFCRYGGEEFALILPSTVEEKAKKMAQRIQEIVHSLRIPHSSSEIENIVTISIGTATMVPNSSSRPHALIEKADSALYLSKTKGRNTVSSVH
ncbi:diguanylate cyclase [Neobacillus pocheonensis]|uniref:diguanylate cyclase domain-containing protein n=1 Tax=Neobacillus pocheonensis TaxID=363869 RepID=UPI003D2BE446